VLYVWYLTWRGRKGELRQEEMTAAETFGWYLLGAFSAVGGLRKRTVSKARNNQFQECSGSSSEQNVK